MTPAEQRAYLVLSSATAPVWLAMIAAPGSAATRRVVRLAPAVQLGLAAAYVGLLGSSVGGEKVSFLDGDSVRRGLSQSRGFLAAWTHMVTLDLVTGQVIWRRGLAERRSTRLALVATWLAGPSGLLVDEVGRRVSRAGAGRAG